MNAFDMRHMLASPSTGSGNRRPIVLDDLMARDDWVLDTKLDGIRAFASERRLVNRQGVDITARFPEIHIPYDLWLDGEIVALDGSFETVARRDKQGNPGVIRRMSGEHPCVFIAFDIPSEARLPWVERRAILESTGVPTTPIAHDVGFFDRVRDLGMEGVIAKRVYSRYQFGRRSADWVKFKHLHRVSCLVAGYKPGQGSRAHMGALALALLDDAGEVRLVGECGSGFTETETWDIKSRVDRGELLVAEIETLNVTSGGHLRFPVFRGLRSDVQILDCTTRQLSTIPRS